MKPSGLFLLANLGLWLPAAVAAAEGIRFEVTPRDLVVVERHRWDPRHVRAEAGRVVLPGATRAPRIRTRLDPARAGAVTRRQVAERTARLTSEPPDSRQHPLVSAGRLTGPIRPAASELRTVPANAVSR